MAGIKLRNIQYTWYFRTWKKLIWKEREKDVERQEMSWNCCIERHMNFKTWPTENLIYSSSRDIVKKVLPSPSKRSARQDIKGTRKTRTKFFIFSNLLSSHPQTTATKNFWSGFVRDTLSKSFISAFQRGKTALMKLIVDIETVNILLGNRPAFCTLELVYERTLTEFLVQFLRC